MATEDSLKSSKHPDGIYIKSPLVGLVMLVVGAVLYVVYLVLIVSRKHEPPPGGEVSLDLGSLVYSPLFWLVALAAFAIGFYWEYRR